jgi:hypothetical protein
MGNVRDRDVSCGSATTPDAVHQVIIGLRHHGCVPFTVSHVAAVLPLRAGRAGVLLATPPLVIG